MRAPSDRQPEIVFGLAGEGRGSRHSRADGDQGAGAPVSVSPLDLTRRLSVLGTVGGQASARVTGADSRSEVLLPRRQAGPDPVDPQGPQLPHAFAWAGQKVGPRVSSLAARYGDQRFRVDRFLGGRLRRRPLGQPRFTSISWSLTTCLACPGGCGHGQPACPLIVRAHHTWQVRTLVSGFFQAPPDVRLRGRDSRWSHDSRHGAATATGDRQLHTLFTCGPRRPSAPSGRCCRATNR